MTPIDFARTIAASNVRRGVWTETEARLILRAMIGFPDPCDKAGYEIVWALNDAISPAETAAYQAGRDVIRAIAPMLDARASEKDVREAAMHAAARRLHRDEIDALIAQERAWWVRLHAQLDHAA